MILVGTATVVPLLLYYLYEKCLDKRNKYILNSVWYIDFMNEKIQRSMESEERCNRVKHMLRNDRIATRAGNKGKKKRNYDCIKAS